MQQEREVSPLALNGLKALERELDKYYRGRSFIYLSAMHLQSECYCHLTRKYIVVGVSPPAENMFLKRHISLKDSLATIIKKLNLYREYRSQDRCEFCYFLNNLNKMSEEFSVCYVKQAIIEWLQMNLTLMKRICGEKFILLRKR